MMQIAGLDRHLSWGKYLAANDVFYLFILLLVSLLIWPSIAWCDSTDRVDSSFFPELGEYFTAPTRWDSEDWLKASLITGGILLISEKYDDKWKQEMIGEDHPYYYHAIDKVGKAWGDMRLSGPFMLGVYAYGQWTNDNRYINAGYDIFESVAYAGAMTQVLKHVFKRDRRCSTWNLYRRFC